MTGLIIQAVSVYTDVGQVVLPAMACLYAVGKKDYQGVGLSLVAVLVNQIGIEGLKDLFNTTRPNGAPRAFPSGNTAAAFLGPCFLIARYGLSVTHPLTCISLIMATLVGIGRVFINVHWPQDIVGGALLGYTVIQLVVPAFY